MSDRPAPPTPAQFKRLSEVTSVREALMHPEMALRMKAAIPKHLSAERMLRVCALAIQKTPKLAECDMMTLLGAMITLGTLGLEPNTPLGQAYLIPFEKRTKDNNGRWVTTGVDVQVVIGYKGYIDLARRSGELVNIHADVVYEGDEFTFEYGTGMHMRHVPVGARAKRKPLWAYFYAKLADGGEAFEVLPYEEILAIRDASQGYQSAMRNRERYPESFSKTPWVAFEHEMAAKTMIRRIAKWLPMSIEAADATTIDSAHEGGATVDYRAVLGGKPETAAAMRALTSDEYVPSFDINQGFGDRESVPARDVGQEPPPARVAQQQREAPAPAAPSPAPQEQPQFYLLDAGGDMVGGPFTADGWVVAFMSQMGMTDPHDRPALLDANLDYIHELPTATADRLSNWYADQMPPPVPMPPPNPPQAPAPSAAREEPEPPAEPRRAEPARRQPTTQAAPASRNNWTAYALEHSKTLTGMTSLDAVEDYVASTADHRATAPSSVQKVMDGDIANARKRLTLDPNLATRDRLIAEIESCETLQELMALDRRGTFSAPLARLKDEASSLWQTVINRAASVRAEFERGERGVPAQEDDNG